MPYCYIFVTKLNATLGGGLRRETTAVIFPISVKWQTLTLTQSTQNLGIIFRLLTFTCHGEIAMLPSWLQLQDILRYSPPLHGDQSQHRI